MSEDSGIYLWDNGSESGPFTRQQVVRLLKSGDAQSDSFARLGEDDEWSSLGEVLTRLTRLEAAKFLEVVNSPPEPLYASAEFPSQPREHHQLNGLFQQLIGKLFGKGLFIFVACGIVGLLGWNFILGGHLRDRDSAVGRSRVADSVLAVSKPSEVQGSVQTDEDFLFQPRAGSSWIRLIREEQTSFSGYLKRTEPRNWLTDPTGNATQDLPLSTSVETDKNDREEVVPLQISEPGVAHAVGEGGATFLHGIRSPTLEDFFKIDSIKVVLKEPNRGVAWLQLGSRRLRWKERIFVPYIEVTVSTSKDCAVKDTFLRIHVLDSDRRLAHTLNEPAIAWRDSKQGYAFPSVFKEKVKERIFFPLPDGLDFTNGSILAVFGDAQSATARVYPQSTSTFGIDFPERALVDRVDGRSEIRRQAAVDPVLETAVETRNPKHPVITLFARLPVGVMEMSDAQGVLAICLLAGNADQVRTMVREMDADEDNRIYEGMMRAANGLRNYLDPSAFEDLKIRLASRDLGDDVSILDDMRIALEGHTSTQNDEAFQNVLAQVQQLTRRVYRNNLVKFANEHKLAILVWGSRTLWNPKLSFSEQTRKVNREMDETFEDVAKAWEAGVDRFNKQYGLPNRNILLTGQSGAAQFASRLALRKPERFLAVHAHIPSSFDKPSINGNQVLWLLTTGENEGGYPAAKKFFTECKALGYPIMFKAIPGLGHKGSKATDQLGIAFFEYALSLQSERESLSWRAQGGKRAPTLSFLQPWPESFVKPEAIGDILNQEVFSPGDDHYVPSDLRVALPTSSLSEAWVKE